MNQKKDNAGVDKSSAKALIDGGAAILGCELGSTTIKSMLISPAGDALATGSHQWENQLVDGIWTYDIEDVWAGLAESFANLAGDVRARHDAALNRISAAGFSAMMHGYIATDENGELLVPFRTWRNNNTATASRELTELFAWPIPQRWSVAHVYQAILDGEEHVGKIAHLTTLAGYVHWKLTGQWTLGIGDASGMFPVDPDNDCYDARMLDVFNRRIAQYDCPWHLEDLLPGIVPVGENAGTLSVEGARLLDASGMLEPGVPLCPPEGDAGTGMVVTNSVRPKTGNVSAGTSVFAMLVLEHKLSAVHPEIDLVLTPDGELVGMVHSNNCTSDVNAWIGLFGEVARALGTDVQDADVFGRVLPLALDGDSDAGGLLNFGYVSGEHITGFSEGRPLFVRQADARFTLANFLRAQLFSALAALRIGFDVLTGEEGVRVSELCGHGGFFKTPEVGQRIMAAAMNTAVRVAGGAGESGAWGMALLAAFSRRSDRDVALADYLDANIGVHIGAPMPPRAEDVHGFERFFDRYVAGLPVEAAAVEHV